MQQLACLALSTWCRRGRGGTRLARGAARRSRRTPRRRDRASGPLWTGKQVISAVLDHVTHGATAYDDERRGRRCPPTTGAARTLARASSSCAKLRVRGHAGQEPLRQHGLVHAVAELHGRVLAGDFMSVLSRLLTVWLQKCGMTCGMDDLILKPRGGGGARRETGQGDRRVPRRGGDVRRGGRERAGRGAPTSRSPRGCGARGRGGGAGHAQLGRAEQSQPR